MRNLGRKERPCAEDGSGFALEMMTVIIYLSDVWKGSRAHACSPVWMALLVRVDKEYVAKSPRDLCGSTGMFTNRDDQNNNYHFPVIFLLTFLPDIGKIWMYIFLFTSSSLQLLLTKNKIK